jgi:hypothetical protein
MLESVHAQRAGRQRPVLLHDTKVRLWSVVSSPAIALWVGGRVGAVGLGLVATPE